MGNFSYQGFYKFYFLWKKVDNIKLSILAVTKLYFNHLEYFLESSISSILMKNWKWDLDVENFCKKIIYFYEKPVFMNLKFMKELFFMNLNFVNLILSLWCRIFWKCCKIVPIFPSINPLLLNVSLKKVVE